LRHSQYLLFLIQAQSKHLFSIFLINLPPTPTRHKGIVRATSHKPIPNLFI